MLFASHKIIASEVYNSIYDNYNVKLNKKLLIWGSIAPDIMPKYKLVRHYKEESLDYIVNQISKLIYVSRFINFNKHIDVLAMNVISKEIGIISHYLSDYMCAPHANRWTMFDSMKKHMSYELELDRLAKTHTFSKKGILTEDINLHCDDSCDLKKQVKKYIETIIHEYSINASLDKDLNFAFDLTTKISYFILDTINIYSEEFKSQLIFDLI